MNWNTKALKLPKVNEQALDFLLSRRSVPAKSIKAPVPNRDEINILLKAAARTPDHGKLEPWRFVVMEKPALERIASSVVARGDLLRIDKDKIEKAAEQFLSANLVIAVVSSPVRSEKVPQIEQSYSAGAVCLALLNAALASGWGANWLSGWPSHDSIFIQENLKLAPHESIAGFVHIGTAVTSPPERPRPDITKKTIWLNF